MSSHNLPRARTGSVGPGATSRLDRAVGRHCSGAHRGRAGGGFAIWCSTRWTLIDQPDGGPGPGKRGFQLPRRVQQRQIFAERPRGQDGQELLEAGRAGGWVMRCWERGAGGGARSTRCVRLTRGRGVQSRGVPAEPMAGRTRHGSAGCPSMSGAVTEAMTATCSVTSAAAFTSAEWLRVSSARSRARWSRPSTRVLSFGVGNPWLHDALGST